MRTLFLEKKDLSFNKTCGHENNLANFFLAEFLSYTVIKWFFINDKTNKQIKHVCNFLYFVTTKVK